MGILFLAACGGGGGTATVGSEPGSPEAAIVRFDPSAESMDASFAAIHLQIDEPTELRQVALDHLDDGDADVHYAALYSLALTAEEGESMDALRRFLSSDLLFERMLAAGSLAVRGEREAVPVLIEALSSDEGLPLREPPQVAWQFARQVLIQVTIEDLGLIGTDFDAEAAAAAQPAWERWWSEVGEGLEWDAASGVFR